MLPAVSASFNDGCVGRCRPLDPPLNGTQRDLINTGFNFTSPHHAPQGLSWVIAEEKRQTNASNVTLHNALAEPWWRFLGVKVSLLGDPVWILAKCILAFECIWALEFVTEETQFPREWSLSFNAGWRFWDSDKRIKIVNSQQLQKQSTGAGGWKLEQARERTTEQKCLITAVLLEATPDAVSRSPDTLLSFKVTTVSHLSTCATWNGHLHLVTLSHPSITCHICHTSPFNCSFSPAIYHLSPSTSHLSPVTWHLSPVTPNSYHHTSTIVTY